MGIAQSARRAISPMETVCKQPQRHLIGRKSLKANWVPAERYGTQLPFERGGNGSAAAQCSAVRGYERHYIILHGTRHGFLVNQRIKMNRMAIGMEITTRDRRDGMPVLDVFLLT